MKNEELLPEKIRKYIKQHDLHHNVTQVLNQLLEEMPDDPFGHLVEVFAKKAVESPCFQVIRIMPLMSGDFHIECVVKIRGMMIRPHEGVVAASCFELHPLQEEQTPAEGEGEAAPETVEKALLDASGFADGPLTKFIEGCSFEEAVKLHGLVIRAVETERRLIRPDDIVVSVVGHCFQAAANASNMSSLQFIQGLLENRPVPLPRSPPFTTPDDAAVWKDRWPRWTFPVTGESPGPFTICIGLPVSAAAGDGALQPSLEALPPLNAAARLEALAQSCRDKLGGVDAATGVKQVRDAALAVAEDCTGVVIVKAQQIHIADSERTGGLYALSDDNQKTVDEMLDFYAELVEASEGWIRVIVGPFAREDQQSHERLRERLPQVAVLCDFAKGVAEEKAATAAKAAAEARAAAVANPGDAALAAEAAAASSAAAEAQSAVNYEAPVKYEGCSYLADFRSASALLEQLERIGEKFLPPAVARVPAMAASVPCTLETILAVPSVEYLLVEDGLSELGTQFHELLASVTVIGPSA